ncbi:hypothetical protein HDF18_03220 [Mucilaginibacter sp. X5P1]|uniref:hypothetical protein n=1 Tax=Mucilaginibacter sp. X5P1 TaxID=2723088 RepID=UPI0016158A17|nr:hypothetical protein [Mucilaginibacter sp. X5P1]MBB6136621.1 hypothetical protein [Mucilaginibacter sp. X5P1]
MMPFLRVTLRQTSTTEKIAAGKDDLFYLRNCGFFSDFTPVSTNLTRQSSKKPDLQLPD